MPHPRFNRTRSRLATVHAIALLIVPTAFAQASTTSAISVTFNISVPSQPLGPAINELARQARLQLLVHPDLVTGKFAPAVSGTLTAQQAMERLLTNSGLTATFNGSQVIVKATPPSVTVLPLPVVTVTAAYQQENASGPIDGYVAKRSATGTKTDTLIIETPQSISVVGVEEMETIKAQSLQDAMGYLAGVNRAEALDRTSDTFYLRGFMSGNGSVFRDGTRYVVNFYNGRQEPYGLERIELLKGAASVLFGSAAPGGIINAVNKRPTTEQLREINLEVGSFNRKQVSGDFSGGIHSNNDWSYRLTLLKRDSDTFIDYVPDNRTFIAPALKWQPDARTSLTFLADFQKDDTTYIDGLPAEGTVLPNANGRMPLRRFTGEPGFDKFSLKRYSAAYLFEHAFNDHWKLRNSVRYFRSKNEYFYTFGWGLSSDQRSTESRGASDRWDHSSSSPCVRLVVASKI